MAQTLDAVPVPQKISSPRWPVQVIRVIAVVLLAQVLVQAGLAGAFISGDVSLLGLHSANGVLLELTSTALIPAAVLLLRPGRGPWWPIVFSVVLWFLVSAQIGFGFARLIGMHIPLGVAIFGMVCGLTWWAFSYRPAVVTAAAPVPPAAIPPAPVPPAPVPPAPVAS
jgi:hypothetical protein